MPLSNPSPVSEIQVTAFNSVNALGGTRISLASPVRGRVVECGVMPASLSASNISLAVAIGTQVSSAASTFTQIITSTLGTVSSLQAIEGGVCSVVPPSPSYVEQGDAIQFTLSGVNVGMSFYARIHRAGV